MKKEGVMLTDVDALLSLLEKRKKVSMHNAAKELNTKVSTIEKWSTVLEEEGLVNIKYSLTTPYLELKQVAKTKHTDLFVGEQELPEPSSQGLQQPEQEQKTKKTEISANQDIEFLIKQVRDYITQGNFLQAQQTYKRIKQIYDSLPVIFLQKKNKVETDLIKLNNELSISLQKHQFEKIKQGISSISDLLAQGKTLIRQHQIDQAIEIYNQIKTIYNSLPDGFYSEKTKLAEEILNFFQKLSVITNELGKKSMDVKTNEIKQLVNEIESHISQKKLSQAMNVYSKLRKVYQSLPKGFLDKKLDIQEKMINIYRQLMIDKKSIIKQNVEEKIRTMKQKLQQANEYMKKRDMRNATVSFNEAKDIFEGISSSFSEQHKYAQRILLKHYRQLIELKKYVSIQSIKQGSLRINKLIQKALTSYQNRDYDIAYDLYSDIIKEYNSLPAGFDPNKLETRKQIYQLYYDIVSGSDFIELGELNPYVKSRYMKLLDLLVEAHRVVDSIEFSLIDNVYSGIYSIYNELPMSMINKKTLLNQEVKRVFEIYRLYQAALSLQKYYYSSDIRALRFSLNYISKNYTSAERNCYGFVKLIRFVKQEYEKYVTKAHPKGFKTLKEYKPEKIVIHSKDLLKDNQPKLVLESSPQKRLDLSNLNDVEKERSKIDHLFHLRKSKQLYRRAMRNMRLKNYKTALKALEKLQELEPDNHEVIEKIKEIHNLRQTDFKKSMVNRLVSAKKIRLNKYLDNKNYDGALQEAYTILELDPYDTEIKSLVNKINNQKNKIKT